MQTLPSYNLMPALTGAPPLVPALQQPLALPPPPLCAPWRRDSPPRYLGTGPGSGFDSSAQCVSNEFSDRADGTVRRKFNRRMKVFPKSKDKGALTAAGAGQCDGTDGADTAATSSGAQVKDLGGGTGSRDPFAKARPEGFGSKGGKKGVGKGPPFALERPEKLAGDAWEEPRENVGLRLVGELASADVRWIYSVRDESRRSYAGYLRSPLLPEQRKELFEVAKNGTAWNQPEGALGLIPRKTGWMVSKGCTCVYRYGGVEVDPEVFPPWMTQLMQIVMPYYGIPELRDWPNSCNLNLYEDGSHTVGWHTDDERLFQGKFQDTRILSLSFGAARRFEVRKNWPEEGEQHVCKVDVGDGDLLTMEGMFQKHFQHRVPKQEYIKDPRINLTWRWVRRHNPRCPAGRSRH